MTVRELSAEQLEELKQTYLDQHIYELYGRSASLYELLYADETVPNREVYEFYEGIVFTDDDFWCTAGSNE